MSGYDSAPPVKLPILARDNNQARQARPGRVRHAALKPDTIERIVAGALCIRCGGCAAVCPPEGVITTDADGCPQVDLDGCIDCRLCLAVCPMHDMDLPALYRSFFNREFTPEQDNYVGPVIDVYVGHSADPQIRSRGSSGGVGVQLLVSLLEAGRIDAATTVVQNPAKPWDFVARLGRTREEILAAGGSKYTIVPANEALRDFWKRKERIALAGLPCQLQSLRLWERFNQKVRRYVQLSIGLFCTTTLTKQAFQVMLKRLRIKPRDVARVEYRKGEWPGAIRVQLHDGREKALHQLDVKYGAFNYLGKTYFPRECLNCVDYCAGLADLALADPWLRGADGDYVYKGGWTLIVTRTERGEQTLHEVADSGALVLKRIDRDLFLRSFAPLGEDKYNYALRRINRLHRRGKPHPLFHLPQREWTLKRRWRAWLYALERIFGTTEFTRRLYLCAGLSPPGVALSRIKATFKRWKFRRRWAKRERAARRGTESA